MIFHGASLWPEMGRIPDRPTPPLFALCPGLAGRPFVPLARVPTPVEPMTALAGELGRRDVWMKRDDLVSPLYGGNKVRRYEYVLGDALAVGASRLVTVGALASTQATATAAFGRELGLAVRVHVFDQPVTRFAKAALLADVSLGAELVYGGSVPRTLLAACRDRREEGSYAILPGAPTPLANVGYVDAMLELAVQVAAGELPRPDFIVLPTGSSGTLAALALGAAHLGWPTEIVGVRITSPFVCNEVTIQVIAEATRRLLVRLGGDFPRRPLRFRVMGGHNGRGYGEPTRAAIENIWKIHTLIGREGEVTYTGKALAGLLALAKDRATRGKTLLFWNTLSAAQPPIVGDAKERVPRALRWVLDAPTVA